MWIKDYKGDLINTENCATICADNTYIAGYGDSGYYDVVKAVFIDGNVSIIRRCSSQKEVGMVIRYIFEKLSRGLNTCDVFSEEIERPEDDRDT